MATLMAFSVEESKLAKQLLAARVAYMMGRKLEEGDWASVYCKARNLQVPDWSNLHADVTIPGLSLEHKMMKRSETQPIQSTCGTSMMHPSLTRRVSLPTTTDPKEAMEVVIAGYQRVLDARRVMAERITPQGQAVELRSGWLLYESSLSEFLYFEELSTNLDPAKHRAAWSERIVQGEGGRRSNRNLWIFNTETNQKVWSVTGGASGTKIQPYFTVPAVDDPNLYYFRVQGERIESGTVRVWITKPTFDNLTQALGGAEKDLISDAVVSSTSKFVYTKQAGSVQEVREVLLRESAYEELKAKFPGESDEHSFQLFCSFLRS